MSPNPEKLQNLIERACALTPVRVAVVDAAQLVVLETVRDAVTLGLVEPRLVGEPDAILAMCRELSWDVDPAWITPATSDTEAAVRAVAMVRQGEADLLMKGNLHTDVLLRAVLDKNRGLRLPGRRVSHVFLVDVPGHDRLIGITDAAINIAPNLTAKAEICQNAVDMLHILGIAEPHVAVLSAVETVASGIASTLDAACLTLMARRGQITGAQVDGPLAFDNAISALAAKEKGILSDVAGRADILLVPDLVSGNILAKALEYLGRAVAAGVAVGLSAPVVLTSRSDPAPARMASLAVAALMHHQTGSDNERGQLQESSIAAAPQAEHACCPLSVTAAIREAAE
ncbi:phosphate acetyl/butaryl transferase [Pelagivirga sediminicola]|uniref:Phosphate acetyl/butaryl transferase n=1 Tax=Pelagivirga sediminicola TaxID=2170575 RepID=A0A2T7G3I2_9RHOB|nr:bifunctional enoyl-CoA hydratase/phosphate acetyltransferase [Pelagivirga sediminicola]PVA08964.1 phosphate acetyl/butaryl transferase [Pelagivirga sediminicola]